jgi:hypothetical protein
MACDLDKDVVPGVPLVHAAVQLEAPSVALETLRRRVGAGHRGSSEWKGQWPSRLDHATFRAHAAVPTGSTPDPELCGGGLQHQRQASHPPSPCPNLVAALASPWDCVSQANRWPTSLACPSRHAAS